MADEQNSNQNYTSSLSFMATCAVLDPENLLLSPREEVEIAISALYRGKSAGKIRYQQKLFKHADIP